MSEVITAEPVALLSELIACDSTNPSLVPQGAGESAVAEIVARELRAAGLEVRCWESLPGRRSVLGRLPGSGGGPTLLLLSHLDVVAADPQQFVARVDGDRMYGRGASDMKGGLTASLLAAHQLATTDPLAGDVLIAAVIDEEWLSAGAEDLVARLAAEGVDVSGAILPEATGLELVVEHGGFAWFQVTAHGAEAAGDDPDNGIDAIAHLGPVLTAVRELDRELATRQAPPYGRACIHTGTIAGGSQLSAYPKSCTVEVERCLVPGETVVQVRAELEAIASRAQLDTPVCPITVEQLVGREAVRLDPAETVVRALASACERVRRTPAIVRGDMGWMDSGVLIEAGIPCVAFGPTGDGEHTDGEWVALSSVAECADVLVATAKGFCDGSR